jgi:hypothetical protein
MGTCTVSLNDWWRILLLTRDRRLNALVICTHDACSRVVGRLSIVGDRKRRACIPRGTAHGFDILCMVSALLVAGATIPIAGSCPIVH